MGERSIQEIHSELSDEQWDKEMLRCERLLSFCGVVVFIGWVGVAWLVLLIIRG